MTDEVGHRDDEQVVARTRGQGEPIIWAAMGVSLILAVIAFVIGINMATDRRVAPCPNGTEFPEFATDLNCYVHPEAGTGTVIALFAVILGTIIVFSGISAALAVQSRARGESAGPEVGSA